MFPLTILHDLVTMGLSSLVQGAILVTAKVPTKVMGWFFNSLQLVAINFLQIVAEDVWVLSNGNCIINTNANVFTSVPCVPDPQVHISKG